MLQLFIILAICASHLFGEAHQTDYPIFIETPTIIAYDSSKKNLPEIRVHSNSFQHHYVRAAQHYQTAFNYEYGRQHSRALTSTHNFATLSAKLPEYFHDTFETRSIISWLLRSDISPSQYEHSFYDNLIAHCGYNYTATQLTQCRYAQMRSWKDYYYPGFREFIKKFPVYEDYLLELDKEFRINPTLANRVQKCEPKAYDTITNEASKIRKKRDHEKKKQEQQTRELERLSRDFAQQQRHLIAQEIFNEQIATLEQALPAWEQSNPERFKAHKNTQELHGLQTTQQYVLSPQAQTTLKTAGFNSADYTVLHGNHLQQELLHEIIDGIEKFSQLPQPNFVRPFESMVHTATLETFDDARLANEIGDCVGASKLIDLSRTLLDYCSAVVEGVTKGAAQGFIDAVNGTYHMVRHPIKTVKALGSVALKLVEIANDYMPRGLPPPWLCLTSEQQAEGERVAQNRKKAKEELVRWWQETPSRDKIYLVTKGATQTITNIIMGNKCLDLLGKVCTLAKIEALALCAKPKPQAIAAGISAEMPPSLLNAMPEAEQVAQAPANALLNTMETINSTTSNTLQNYCRITPEVMEEAVKYVMVNKIVHIFRKAEHNLGPLVAQLGSEENTVRAILKAASTSLPADGIFRNIPLNISGFTVHVRGRVIDGIPKIGTFYIP